MALVDQQLAAWRSVVTSHAAVTDRVQKAFSGHDLPPLSWFEVLAAVEGSPDGPPKMSDLADWLTLSRGGITKLVDRLSDAGYVERVSCAGDRRSLQAELTPAGARILKEMRGVYAAEVSRYLSSVSAEEAQMLTSVLGRITGSTCDSAKAEGAPALEAA